MSGYASATDDSRIYGNAQVFGNAQIRDNSIIFENARVFSETKLDYDSCVCGDAWISVNWLSSLVGAPKIDHGVWTRVIYINRKWYLVSTTLEKIYVVI